MKSNKKNEFILSKYERSVSSAPHNEPTQTTIAASICFTKISTHCWFMRNELFKFIAVIIGCLLMEKFCLWKVGLISILFSLIYLFFACWLACLNLSLYASNFIDNKMCIVKFQPMTKHFLKILNFILNPRK